MDKKDSDSKVERVAPQRAQSTALGSNAVHLKKYVHFLKVERPPETETATEARQRLADKFPRGSTRRMTHLGMLIGSACDGLVVGRDDAVVYATTWAETRALEDFLMSFPMASPQGFQTSIHPSAVQQVLIGRQQPVRRFWPITGRARLVEHALVTALLEPAATVVLVGGEERGTWLLEQKAASEKAFAFAIMLRGEIRGAIGRISLTGSGEREQADADSARSRSPLLLEFAHSLEAHTPAPLSSGDRGDQDRLVMTESEAAPRNAGPSWGFGFLSWADRYLPEFVLSFFADIGAWIGVIRMKEQRRYSRDYLSVVLGRPPRLGEVWRHFRAFTEFIFLRMRVGRGVRHRCSCTPPDSDAFDAFLKIPGPALLGTFHFGRSDLMGFFLTERGVSVAMVRLQMANAEDTRRLSEMFSGVVKFIWANEPATIPFAIKEALEAGHSLVMDCDRIEHTSKTETFRFLGADRVFPFTIYHIAILFGRPVMFCIGMPDGRDGTRVLAEPAFIPDATTSRAANLVRARTHFQAVLERLETLVRQNPTLWFNFLPLNPPADDSLGRPGDRPSIGSAPQTPRR